MLSRSRTLQEHHSKGASGGEGPAPALFHFSDRGGIARFEPRPVEIPSPRPPGRDWLNGPLVWAIDEAHEPLYLFPRDCPRILIWATDPSSAEERDRWLGGAAFVGYVEASRARDFETGFVWRYRLSQETFEDLRDAGMWVSRIAVTPIEEELLTDLPAALASRDVTLKIVESLAPLWKSSLHVSGLRLRNSTTWRGV